MKLLELLELIRIINFCVSRQGLVPIYNSGGIPYLVQLLMSPVDAVLFFAIATLHNLLEHYVPSKIAIWFAGMLKKH